MKNLLLILDSLLNKRQKIIITTVLVFLGFMMVTQQNVVLFREYHYIAILAVITYILTLWTLLRGMTWTKAFTVLVLPVFYVISIIGFYFLFQQIRWLTRIPAAIFFGLSFYCLLLAQNVFHVASDRAIPLYRAASTANFVYTIFTLILAHSIIFSFSLPFYWNGVLITLISFPVILQSLWAIKMDTISPHIVIYSLVMSLLLGEGALSLSFWPGSPLVLALFLNSVTYGMLGVVLEMLKDRLNRRVAIEYSSVGGILFSTILLISFFLS